MKILLIAAAFPPHIIGGGELSALNLTRLLTQRGHQVTVLTMAEPTEPELHNHRTDEGYHIYRLYFPRAYTFAGHPHAPKWQKPFWHLQDYIDVRSNRVLRKVLDEVQPEHIDVHTLNGIGFTILNEIARYKAPSTTYWLHDLNLACFKGSMFKNGKDCPGQCPLCVATSFVKNTYLNGIPGLGICSVSQATLSTVQTYVPTTAKVPSLVIRNIPDPLPANLTPHQPSSTVRLLYAGRYHATKGVDLLLRSLAPLASRYNFHLTLLGRGELEEPLKAEFPGASWVTFGGFVSQDTVTQAVVSADLLCTPSLWAEPYGRVTAQAQQVGTPVIGSDRGGTIELVRHNQTGLIVKAGDQQAWQNAFEDIFQHPEKLATWRQNTVQYAHEFDTDYLGQRYENFIDELKTAEQA